MQEKDISQLKKHKMKLTKEQINIFKGDLKALKKIEDEEGKIPEIEKLKMVLAGSIAILKQFIKTRSSKNITQSEVVEYYDNIDKYIVGHSCTSWLEKKDCFCGS